MTSYQTRSTSPQAIHDPLSRRRNHLLWRIHRRYRTNTETVHLGPLALEFTRIADPNHVLDQVAEEEDRLEKISGRRRAGDELHLPYWAELWDSALGLGQWLVEHGITFARPECADATAGAERAGASVPPSVLDLGCGMGLAGAVAARLGARVLFADRETPPLLLARLNSLADSHRCRFRRLDWRTDRLGERFDLILGADILYERPQWEFLEAFWRVHLATGGRILLGEPGRQTGEAFIDWIASRGWRLTEHQEPVAARARPIRIFLLERETLMAAGIGIGFGNGH